MKEDELKNLFIRGDCLTFDYTSTPKNFCYCEEKRKLYKKDILIKSKAAVLALENPPFHYFNNGVLLCSMFANNEALIQFKKLLRKKGYMLREERFYSSDNNKYDFVDMRAISDYACQAYPCDTDIRIVDLPSPEEFARSLFADNNICYTASKNENIDPQYRQFLALFSDGQFIVSDEYTQSSKLHDYLDVKDFCSKYKKYLYLRAVYVPANYIKELYKYAQKFDWYISEKEHMEKWKEKHTFRRDSKEAIKMNMYIDKLIQNNECLSVVNPLKNIMSPDRLKYAFFADGSLVIDENVPYWNQDDLCKELSKIFPNLTITIKTVPSPYIPEIYLWLLNHQKSAKQIYKEMLNDKIKYLQNNLQVSKTDAEKSILKSSGFASWDNIEQIDEAQARYLISLEKRKIKTAQELNRDYVIDEYRGCNI